MDFKFAAAFFRIEPNVFNETAKTIILRNLPEGLKAATEVAGRRIKQYSEIHRRFPHAPLDNELAWAHIWDVKDPTDWSLVEMWQSDIDLSWYYHILFYLKHTILK